MKITINTFKPRNPLVAAAHLRQELDQLERRKHSP